MTIYDVLQMAHCDDFEEAAWQAPVYSLCLSQDMPRRSFMALNIRLHLLEMISISRLDVFSQPFYLFQDLRDCIGVLPHYFDLFQDLRGGFCIVSDL